MSRLPFTVIPSKGSEDVARCVAELQAGVRQKAVIGLAYVVIYRHRRYDTHLCGEADRSPTFALGAVQVLDDKLRDRIQGK